MEKIDKPVEILSHALSERFYLLPVDERRPVICQEATPTFSRVVSRRIDSLAEILFTPHPVENHLGIGVSRYV